MFESQQKTSKAAEDLSSNKIQQAKTKCKFKLRKQVKIVFATWAKKQFLTIKTAGRVDGG